MPNEDCLDLANDFILRFYLPVSRVTHLKQIRSLLFVHLYYALVGPFPAVVCLHPKSDEDEIQNLDAVIASLPSQIRHALNATKILHGNEEHIHDLLQIFITIEGIHDSRECVSPAQPSASKSMDTSTPSSTKFSAENDCSSTRSLLLETAEEKNRPKGIEIPTKEKKSEENSGMSFLQFVKSKLDVLDAPKPTKYQLKKKYDQYLKFEAKSVANCVKRRSESQVALEEAKRRQTILSKLVTKECQHGERLENVRQQRRDDLAEQRRLRERRMHSVKVKRSRDEAATALRKANFAQKNKGDEKFLKELCDENLLVRKTRLMAYLKDDKEQKEAESVRFRQRSEAAGKFYEDQLSMLAGSLQAEVASLSAQEQAQSKLVEELKRESNVVRKRNVQKRMEMAIQNVQRDVHHRELDVKRLKEELWKMP